MPKIIEITPYQLVVTRATYEACASVYAEKVEWADLISDQVKKRLVQPLNNEIPRNSCVAVLGCGTGRDVKEFKKYGHNVIGFDLSKGMLEVAKQKVPNVEFRKIDLSKDPLPEILFDALYADSVLSYIPHNRLCFTLNSFYSSLKPGGKGLLGFKINGYGVLQDNILNIGGEVSSRFYQTYPRDYVEAQVLAANFKIIKSKVYKDSLERPTKWYDIFVVKPD